MNAHSDESHHHLCLGDSLNQTITLSEEKRELVEIYIKTFAKE